MLKRLRAGPLTLDYDNGDLRTFKFGERAIFRRIYGAARNGNWDKVPGVMPQTNRASLVTRSRARRSFA